MSGEVRFRSIKTEIRVLGLSRCVPDPKNPDGLVIVGVVYRGRLWLDGVIWTRIPVDGRNATEKIAAMITNSPHHKQLRVIVTERLTLKDHDLLNQEMLFKMTGLPVITLAKGMEKGKIVKQISTMGISQDDTLKVIEVSSTAGAMPEALRAADLIAVCLTKLA